MSEPLTPVTVLLVDDEPLARERMRTGLAGLPEVEIVGECADGIEAVAAISRDEADLVLLDIQMPGLDGFGVVEQVGAARMPAVVFVTAYDSYALRAFEVHALDYVLKPFEPARFEAAVRRGIEQVGMRRAGELERRLASLLRELPPEPGLRACGDRYASRILVREGEGFGFVETERLDWLEATGNYVRLYVGQRSWLIRATLGSVQASLDPSRFVRIHRSTIVNVERVREIQPWVGGDYIAILKDGRQLRVSRTYRAEILRPIA